MADWYTKTALKSRLSVLPPVARVAFGAASASRVAHVYTDYVRFTGTGTLRPVSHALDRAWAVAEGAAPDAVEMSQAKQGVAGIMPRVEAPSGTARSLAEDSLAAVFFAAQAAELLDVDGAAWAAGRTIDVVTAYEEQVWEHAHDHPLPPKLLFHRPIVARLGSWIELDFVSLETATERHELEIVRELRDRAAREHVLPPTWIADASND